MHVTKQVAEQLYTVGFTYHYYQEHIHAGMVFQIGEKEHVIGGAINEPLAEKDRLIVQQGMWLPSINHLIEWLNDNNFSFAIINQNGSYEIQCKDTITGRKYHTQVPTLDFALAVVIKKILLKRERKFDTGEKIYGIIDDE